MEQKERKKRKMSFTTVGGSSILTIFAVLCFVVFALLSLSTAKANSQLTEKSIRAMTDYYKADTEAEDILAKVRMGQGIPANVKVINAKTTKSGVKRIVAENVAYIGWDAYAAYTCPIDENQELQCEVLVRYGKVSEGAGYQVIKWKKVYTGEWKPDDSMPVYDGEDGSGLPGMVTIDE